MSLRPLTAAEREYVARRMTASAGVTLPEAFRPLFEADARDYPQRVAISNAKHREQRGAPSPAKKDHHMFSQQTANALADRLAARVDTLKSKNAKLEAQNKGLVRAVRAARADGDEADLDAVQKAIKAIKKCLADSDDAAGDLKKIRKALDSMGGDSDAEGDDASRAEGDEAVDSDARHALDAMGQRFGLVTHTPGMKLRRTSGATVAVFGDVMPVKAGR